MCKPPAGDVAARNIHGDDLLAEHDARSHFGFKIMEAFPLRLGKARNLLMSELDIPLDAFRDRIDEALPLLRREDEVGIPFVKLASQFAHCRFSPGPDFLKHGCDGFPGFLTIGFSCFDRFLEPFHGDSPYWDFVFISHEIFHKIFFV